jgi:maltooligosyltrehalose trehalohydrolase
VSEFEVWAPSAGMVELVLGDRRLPMAAGDGGWWRLEVAAAGHGTDYRFALDGGEPLPDPRSPWQPAGVAGPSRTVDHAAFRWHDAGWRAPPLAAAIIYELHVGTFTPEGTFDAVTGRLDHLVELGVTHVELMPVAEFPGQRGWGYDGVDLFAPHHAYGGPEALKRLVDAAHGRGLAVLFDVVYNHLGPSGNHLGRFGPYFTERYRTPWGDAIDFDGPGSVEVRRFVCDNAVAWLRDYHGDGLRIDAEHAIFDRSAIPILEQLAAEVRALEIELGRPLALIVESDRNDPRLVQPPAAGGVGLDAHWNEDFHHALHVALTGERSGYYADYQGLPDLAATLREGYAYAGRYSAYRRRIHGRPAVGLTGTRLVGFAQNHDQVGNRARGERLAALVSPARLKVAAALVLTAPFVPLLFQGEEWGASSPFLYFADHRDPSLARAVREGRRAEFTAFGWDPQEVPDPQAEATFERSRLDWSEVGRDGHAELLAWHRDLIALRRATPALLDGRLDRVRVRTDEREGWLLVERQGARAGSGAIVAVNLGRALRVLSLPAAGRAGRVAPGWRLALRSDPAVAIRDDLLRLPSDAVAILVSHEGRADGFEG